MWIVPGERAVLPPEVLFRYLRLTAGQLELVWNRLGILLDNLRRNIRHRRRWG
jgi:hypothetical protein